MLKKTQRICLVLGVPLVICLMGLVNGGCVSGMFYYPDKAVYHQVQNVPGVVESVQFKSLDGTKLHGWFCRSEQTNPVSTVIHFHGNAQNLTSHIQFSHWLTKRGFNVFIFDYRGYGQSEGEQGRAGLVKDGAAAMAFVRGFPGVDPENLVVLGQSLGAAVATAVMGKHGADGVRAYVVDSSFYSYVSIVRDKIGVIPVLKYLKWPLAPLLITNSRSPHRYLADLPVMPKMVIHGTADRAVPFHHGEKIFEGLENPKTFVRVEGGRHIDAFIMEDSPYRDLLVKFLEDACLKD